MTILTPFLVAIFLGYYFLKRFLDEKDSTIFFLFELTVSLGLGIGIISIIMFWGLQLHLLDLYFVVPKIINKIILITLFTLSTIVLIKKVLKQKNKFNKILFQKETTLFIIIFIIVFIVFIDRLWWIISMNPDGFWDAWAIWNLHAKFLYLGGEFWKDLYSPILIWSHNEYPLLTPGFIYFGWKILGSDTQLIPILLSIIFTIGTIGLILTSLTLFRNSIMGFSASIFLMVTLPFSHQGASQYADIPLAFFYLAVLVFNVYSERQKIVDSKLQIILGLLLGFCIFTKNEGWSFVVSFLITSLLIDFFNKKFIFHKWTLLLLASGMVALPSILIKLQAPANDLLSHRNWQDILFKIGDWKRYKIIFSHFQTEILNFNNGQISIIVLLVVLLFLVGFRTILEKRITFLLFGTIFFTSVQYFLIYLITPKELNSHLINSLARLVMQLYPSFIFFIFYIIKNPFQYENLDE